MPWNSSQSFARETERLLSAITTPVFSEVVIIFTGGDVYCPSGSLAPVTREIRGTKEFRVAFCLETSEKSRAESLRKLTLETERAVAVGVYHFLPRPPLAPSRSARCDRSTVVIGGHCEYR